MEDDDEHSTENKLMEEAEHYSLPQCDAFKELNELDDSDLIGYLPGVDQVMEEAASVASETGVGKEVTEMEEMITELVKVASETELLEVITGTLDAEVAKETLEMDIAREVSDSEVTKEALWLEVANQTSESDAVKQVSVTEVDKETTEMEGLESKETTEMETAKETTEIEAEKETTDVELVKEVSEMAVVQETTKIEALEIDAVEEESEMGMTKEASGVEVVKEALETEVAKESPRPRRGGGKRKRGRTSVRVQSRPTTTKKEEEDVCFICFDGGNLVLCDRRGCPKAYHHSCVNRSEEFFRSRGRWTCGWHICSQCQKPSQYMCYTCTYSLCKGCIKEAEFLCVRGNKGLCGACMKTVMLIEHNASTNKEMVEVDFDDKSSWEYLFKDYWLDLKGKLSITFEELTMAKNPWKGSVVSARNEESSGELYGANDDQGSNSDSSLGHNEASNSTRKKAKKQSRSFTNEESSSSAKKPVRNEVTSMSEDTEWASNELLELVAHMKDGNKSVLSQYDVQELLLEYIKRNNLRDPRKKSQIVCDSRLQSLFGKARVGHFEMLKLLESHFLIKDAPDDTQVGVLDAETFYVEAESNSDLVIKSGSDKRRKTRKRVEERERQTNLDDYAAIDVHNINLVYLKRNLMEDSIDDMDKFQDAVVGSFVRIRISGTGQKQDMYRLVQVVGTRRASEAYKTGKKTTDVMLEILNLNKTEVISIDTISNQEFSEEECKRLRQSIKCGFISRLTVGEIQEKAKALQAVRVKDSLEAELLRFSHLRDRASETGRRKDLRECVEKLELLNTPEERSRRLQEIPEVHTDPKMDPSYISDEEEGDLDDKKQDNYSRSSDAGFPRKGREQIYPGKGGSVSNDGWNGARKASSTSWKSSRNMLTKGVGWDKGDAVTAASQRTTEYSWNQGDVHQPNSWDTPKSQEAVTSLETGALNSQPVTRSGLSPSVVLENAPVPSSGIAVSSNVNENDKIWHYRDPSGKIQGPFNMSQLRKWSKTGYFPADLRIWKISEKQEVSILLTDALIGKFQKEPLQKEPLQNSFSSHGTNNVTLTDKQQNDGNWKLNSKDASGPPNGNADGRGTRSSGLAAPTADLVNPKEIYSARVRDSLKVSNALSGQTQNHSPRPTTPSLSGQSHQMPSHNARDGKGGGNASRWDSSQNCGNAQNTNKTSGFPSSSSGQSREGWKVEENSSPKDREMLSAALPRISTAEGWGADHGSRNDLLNLPTLTPKPSGRGWTAGQGAENTWSASSTVPVQATAGGFGAHQSSGIVNGPIKTASGWGEQPHSRVKPLVVVWDSDVTSPSVLKATEIAVVQQTTAPEANALHSLTSQAVPEQSTIVNLAAGSNATPLGSSEAKCGGNISLGFEDHHLGPLLGSKLTPSLGPYPTTAKSVMSVDGQGPNPPSSGAALRSADLPSHTAEIPWQAINDVSVKDPISSVPVSESLPSTATFVSQSNTNISNWSAPSTCSVGQPSGLDVGSSAAVGNSQNNATSANAWKSCSAIEPPILVNTGWSNVPTEIPNIGWGVTPENSNLDWVGAQGNANMGWAITQQGNTGTGWVTGALGNTSTGWGTGPPGNANLGWGLDAQGNTNVGWGAIPQGNANAGLDTSAGNSNIWGNQPKHAGERFSGQGDRGFQASDYGHGGVRPWNRPSGGGGSSRAPPRGPRVCKFHENGYCKKGASCDYLHT